MTKAKKIAYKTNNQEILYKLINLNDINILSFVAHNKHTSSKLLDKIIEKALANKDNYEWVLFNLIENKNISSKSLDYISDKLDNKDIMFFISIIQNKNTTSETLGKIIEKTNYNYSILQSVSFNEKTSSEMLDKIIDRIDYDIEIFETICDHRNTSNKTFNKISSKRVAFYH